MKFLLTGSTGFIGQALSSKLFNCRHVLRKSSSFISSDAFYIDNFDDNVVWDGCFDGIDVIIHLAGIAHHFNGSYDSYNIVNTKGTLHFASEAANAGVKRFIYISSIGVIGSNSEDSTFSPDSTCKPENFYSQSKLDAEVGLRSISDNTPLEIVIIRPPLVYGRNAPGNFSKLVNFIKICPILPFGLAKNCRDFISVTNLTDLIITCASHPNAAGQLYLASDFERVSIKQFTNYIASGLNKPVIQLPIPVTLLRFIFNLFGKAYLFDQLFGDLKIDSSNIKNTLDWSPPVSISQELSSLSD